LSGWDTFNFIALRATRLAYINLLWIFFTLVGLVFFGFFPATVAMYTLTRKWTRGEDNFKIFLTFWQTFRSEFLKVNGHGIIFILAGYFLYVDFVFLKLHNEKLQILFPVIYLFMFIGIITLVFFFPVYVHYKLNFFQYFKQSFLIAITSPAEIILIGLTGGAIYLVAYMLPGIIPLFPGSLFAYASMMICNRSFDRIKLQQEIDALED